MNNQKKEVEEKNNSLYSRRNFLRTGGLVVAGSGLILAGCNDDDAVITQPNPDPDPAPFDLGSGDVGVLNYAYALEQLEAAFYQMVLDGSYWMGLGDGEEKTLFEDLRNHEVIHREFFRTALGAATDEENILPELEFDFSSVDFSSRSSVLQTARILEDTGVTAYNGGGAAISNADYLVIAGKIVSVEARHASAIRSLIDPVSKDFAGNDIVDENGLGPAEVPSVVIQAVADTGFITTEFTANELP